MSKAGNGKTSFAVRPSRFPWPPILLVATIAAGWALAWVAPIGWPGLDDAPAHIFGYGLGLAGVGLMIWAMLTLRAAHTTILPHKGATALVTSGPYRFRRHPIYLADVLILLGLAELTKN